MSTPSAVVVGAGLAGLVCACELTNSGVEVTVLEASDRPGGRVATDVIDGFVIDRGFQLLNPSYPAVQRYLDLDALSLKAFDPGIEVVGPHGRTSLTDPARRPLQGLRSVVAHAGTLRGRLALGAMLARLRFGPVRAVTPDRAARSWLRAKGIDETTITEVVAPFLSGVLLEPSLESSASLVALLLRSFASGSPGVPRAGMAAIPTQLASRLDEGTLRYGRRVTAVASNGVTLDGGERLDADAVVVAADLPHATRVVSGLAQRATRSVTTWWFSAEEPLASGKTLVVDAVGPLVNSVEMTAAAPSYGPPGAHLVAASALGLPERGAEATVRRRLAALHGCSTEDWELVAVTPVEHALPSHPPGRPVRPPIEVDGIILAGDHVATPSIQGAMASGRRAARAVLHRMGSAAR